MTGEWQLKAACRGLDSEVFFCPNKETQEIALRLCNQCPVKRECLEFALAEEQTEGVWGGKLPEDRVKMKAAAQAAVSPPPDASHPAKGAATLY